MPLVLLLRKKVAAVSGCLQKVKKNSAFEPGHSFVGAMGATSKEKACHRRRPPELLEA